MSIKELILKQDEDDLIEDDFGTERLPDPNRTTVPAPYEDDEDEETPDPRGA